MQGMLPKTQQEEIKEKLRVLRDLCISPSYEERKMLKTTVSRNELDRVARSIIQKHWA